MTALFRQLDFSLSKLTNNGTIPVHDVSSLAYHCNDTLTARPNSCHKYLISCLGLLESVFHFRKQSAADIENPSSKGDC
jgi:hypothetical protein